MFAPRELRKFSVKALKRGRALLMKGRGAAAGPRGSSAADVGEAEIDAASPPGGIPIPSFRLRQMVGPTDPEAFDNPSGAEVYAQYGVTREQYDSVLDFGCGCGRMARQLLQQNPRPRRYVGVDIHQGMIDWCKRYLAPRDPNFQFFHHDVYAPGYAPRNTLQLGQPLPVADGQTTLVIAHSVFSHLFRTQTEYYLRELARILSPGGVAFTSWFFFDRESFPFLSEGPYCLFASEVDPTQAVLYDRKWFIEAVREAGLVVSRTTPPEIPGHQWLVFLTKRRPGELDQFPLGEDGADRICGATLKPMAKPTLSEESAAKARVIGAAASYRSTSTWPEPPPLFGVLAELDAVRKRSKGGWWR